MAFPFMRMPTLGEFIRQAVELCGAKLHNSAHSVQDSQDGRTTQPRYLTREYDGQTFHVVLPDIPDTEVLISSLLRSLCDRLGIAGLYPGLSLGDNRDDPPLH